MYLHHIACALYSVCIYAWLRIGIDNCLRYNKHSKTYISKNKRGFANYWFYKKLHSDGELSLGYYLNGALLLLTLAFSSLAVSLGWCVPLGMLFLAFSMILFVLQAAAITYTATYFNLYIFGRPFVLWQRNERGYRGHSSTVIDAWLLCIHALFWYVMYFR